MQQPNESRDRWKVDRGISHSDLPYKVDIVDWTQTSEEFRKIIAQAKVALRPQLVSVHTRCVVKRSPIPTKDLTHEKRHDIADYLPIPWNPEWGTLLPCNPSSHL